RPDRAGRQSDERVGEDEPEQQAPEAPVVGTCRDEVVGLLHTDAVASTIPRDARGIEGRGQMLLLQLVEASKRLFGLFLGGWRHGDHAGHTPSLTARAPLATLRGRPRA